MYTGFMDDTNKMLRAIINGQAAFKQEIFGKLNEIGAKVVQVDAKLDSKIGELGKQIQVVEKNLTKRIDKLGIQLARLEDDAPTREEHDNLEKRVTEVERRQFVAV